MVDGVLQREALTHQFYSLGESPRLVSVTPSVELNVTAGAFNTERKYVDGLVCVCVCVCVREREREREKGRE